MHTGNASTGMKVLRPTHELSTFILARKRGQPCSNKYFPLCFGVFVLPNRLARFANVGVWFGNKSGSIEYIKTCHFDELVYYRAVCKTATHWILCLIQRNMSITICVKWSGKEYEVTELAATDTVETLKVGWKYEWNSCKPCTLRLKSWGRLGWDQRDRSCWIWR